MVFLAIVIAVGGGLVGGLIAGGDSGSGTASDNGSRRGTAELPLVDLVEKVGPSVVTLEVRVGPRQGVGAGVVVSRDGLILTNHHVAGGADEIQVTFNDERSLSAELVDSDPDLDLAVVRVEDADNLVAAKIGDSDKLRVGERVVAIGSPLGFEGSVTSGIVSGLDRTIEPGGDVQREMRGLIQTDAAINFGNSGGPLLNLGGEVIGINTVGASTDEDGGNIGLSFAVPVNAAKDLLRKAGN